MLPSATSHGAPSLGAADIEDATKRSGTDAFAVVPAHPHNFAIVKLSGIDLAAARLATLRNHVRRVDGYRADE